MRCERIQEDLPAYLEGALGWLARRRVEAHLQGCEACRLEVGAHRRTVALLRQAGGERIPRDITASVMARLPEHAAAPVPRRVRPVLLVPAAVAAAALALQLSVNPPREKAVAENPSAAYLHEYAQFRASQEIGDSTGILLLANELAEEAR